MIGFLCPRCGEKSAAAFHHVFGPARVGDIVQCGAPNCFAIVTLEPSMVIYGLAYMPVPPTLGSMGRQPLAWGGRRVGQW